MTELDKACMLQELLSVTNSLISNHKVNMNKIDTIFGKDIKNIFAIIREDEFVSEIRGLNQTLNKKLMLPQLPILDLLKMTRIQTSLQGMNISIVMRVPLVDDTTYTVGKFVAVPMTMHNETVIIDTKVEYFVETSEEIFTISPENLAKCVNVKNFTICNSLIRHAFEKPNKCMYSYMKNSSVEFCTLIKTTNKNEIIEINSTSIFIYLVNPIDIKIIYEGREQLIKMERSDIVHFLEGSEIVLYTNKSRKTSVARKILNMTTLSYKFYINDFDEDRWQLRSLNLSKSEMYLYQLENATDYENQKIQDNNGKIDSILLFMYSIVSDQLFITVLWWSFKWIIVPYVIFRVAKLLLHKITIIFF